MNQLKSKKTQIKKQRNPPKINLSQIRNKKSTQQVITLRKTKKFKNKIKL